MHINEIAKQAGYMPYTPTEEAFNEFSIDKFARLIVKECIDALEHESDRLDVNNDYESGYQQGVNHAVHLLTNHFKK